MDVKKRNSITLIVGYIGLFSILYFTGFSDYYDKIIPSWVQIGLFSFFVIYFANVLYKKCK